MSKNVLILSSSPRKGGNSDLLCDEFMRGAVCAGNQVEKVRLAEQNIQFCNACGSCVKNPGHCPLKDDMDKLKEKLVAADVVVLATPVYFYTMAAQLKQFIDRNAYFYQDVEPKEYYYLMTSADDNKSAMKRVIEEFRGYMACLGGGHERGMVFGTGTWDKGDIVGSRAMKEAYEMGKKV